MLLLNVNCNAPQQSQPNYIEFVHIGLATRLFHPLFISQRKINITLNNQDLKDLKHFVADSANITKSEIEAYINIKFDQLITDSSTFSSICQFIIDHKEYYTDDYHQNIGSFWGSYNIHFGDRKFSLYYKMEDEFFRDLQLFLKRRRCDEHVISAVSHLK
jgi:hypothetical protein